MKSRDSNFKFTLKISVNNANLKVQKYTAEKEGRGKAFNKYGLTK